MRNGASSWQFGHQVPPMLTMIAFRRKRTSVFATRWPSTSGKRNSKGAPGSFTLVKREGSAAAEPLGARLAGAHGRVGVVTIDLDAKRVALCRRQLETERSRTGKVSEDERVAIVGAGHRAGVAVEPQNRRGHLRPGLSHDQIPGALTLAGGYRDRPESADRGDGAGTGAGLKRCASNV